jgi:hypothetical protein
MPVTDSIPQLSRSKRRRPLALGAAAAGAAAAGVIAFLKRRRLTSGPAAGAAATGSPRGSTPAPAAAGADAGERAWTCGCGQEYRVQGVDRHRVYWLAGADASDPVLAAECPSCGRLLPREHEHPESVPGESRS